MEYEDKVIVCEDCQTEFTHSGEDQARYASRGFTSDPKRCRECRQKRKERSQQSRGGGGPRRGGGGGGEFASRRHREEFETVCAACGVTTTVPFKPRGDRPVYCRDCFRSQKQ